MQWEELVLELEGVVAQAVQEGIIEHIIKSTNARNCSTFYVGNILSVTGLLHSAHCCATNLDNRIRSDERVRMKYDHASQCYKKNLHCCLGLLAS
jgi:hypothetical protein